MIIEAFVEWLETARTADRVRAAEALALAWCTTELTKDDRQSVRLSMTCLLDDCSPRVRLALAEGLFSNGPANPARHLPAPREIMLTLAHDQPEIAYRVIICAETLTDTDLVELAAKGDDHSAAFVAARPNLSAAVSAAIAEVGDVSSAIILLENHSAILSRSTLIRIVERHGHSDEIRMMLDERDDLPTEARQLLVECVGEALATSSFIQAIIGNRRMERVRREATDSAVVDMVASARARDLPGLVEHLRTQGKLTPSFLIHALCRGRVDFFAASIVNLSGMPENRVVSLIGDGRFHAIRALFEASGLSRDIAHVFVETTLIWRQEQHRLGVLGRSGSLFSLLERRYSDPASREGAVGELLEMVERLDFAERRQIARHIASQNDFTARRVA